MSTIARLAATLLVACAGQLPAQTAPPTNTPAPVGMTQIQAGDLPVTLVYPSAEPARTLSAGPFVLQVAPDAPPLPGRRRLVVMSHGTGGSAVSDHTLAATLARAGFVVAQPQHGGDNYLDSSRAGPSAWGTRPQEVTRVIDALAAHPRWQARLQLDKVGVHGMSAGGVTGLALAGAQWRLLDVVRHCLAHGEADLGFCMNGALEPQAQAARKASYEGVRGVPEHLLPADMTRLQGGRTPGTTQPDVRPDPRVAAVTLSVPVAAIFSADSLARIAVPVGLVTATRDTTLLPAFHSEHLLRHCRACTRLADLQGAGHFDLLSPWPEGVARSVAAQQARGGLPEAGFDARMRDAAFDAIAGFFTAHLLP